MRSVRHTSENDDIKNLGTMEESRESRIIMWRKQQRQEQWIKCISTPAIERPTCQTAADHDHLKLLSSPNDEIPRLVLLQNFLTVSYAIAKLINGTISGSPTTSSKF